MSYYQIPDFLKNIVLKKCFMVNWEVFFFFGKNLGL